MRAMASHRNRIKMSMRLLEEDDLATGEELFINAPQQKNDRLRPSLTDSAATFMPSAYLPTPFLPAPRPGFHLITVTRMDRQSWFLVILYFLVVYWVKGPNRKNPRRDRQDCRHDMHRLYCAPHCHNSGSCNGWVIGVVPWLRLLPSPFFINYIIIILPCLSSLITFSIMPRQNDTMDEMTSYR